MFKHKHYLPILKGRTGELSALEEVPPSAWGVFTPLIEIPAIPSKWLDNGSKIPNATIGKHVAAVARKIVDAIPKAKRFFVDGFYIQNEEALPDKQEPIAAIMGVLRSASLQAVPVVGVRRVFEYLASAKAAHEKDHRGYCLRVSGADLPVHGLNDRIKALLEFLAIEPKDVDLVLDFEAITEDSAPNFIAAAPAQLARFPFLEKWRTLTLAATAIPQNLGQIPANTIKPFRRYEMDLWQAVLKSRPRLKRLPAFGDYAATHPFMTEINPRFINKSPSIKYAGTNSWIIARGKAKPKKKKNEDGTAKSVAVEVPPDSVQYPKLAAQIMDCESWRGESFSWGDGRIAECVRKRAAKKKATGGNSTWVSVATSHHIAVVVEQIANLPDL
jgi:Beta protein